MAGVERVVKQFWETKEARIIEGWELETRSGYGK